MATTIYTENQIKTAQEIISLGTKSATAARNILAAFDGNGLNAKACIRERLTLDGRKPVKGEKTWTDYLAFCRPIELAVKAAKEEKAALEAAALEAAALEAMEKMTDEEKAAIEVTAQLAKEHAENLQAAKELEEKQAAFLQAFQQVKDHFAENSEACKLIGKLEKMI
jgi:hypothetical protein